MSTANRSALLAATERVRAYFAPVARSTSQPLAFDLANAGRAALATPPTGWFDAGWITGFTRTAATAVRPLRAGAAGAVAQQVRNDLEARVEFNFCEWGKLQAAIAGGAEHFNLLTPGFAAAALQPGSTSTELPMAAADLARFAAGNLVAIDVDYAGATGYLGSGIAGAYVSDAAAINGDADFVRRVTFNVARVASVGAAALTLGPALLGGAPANGAKVQTLTGFSDREGGSYFQEWSALFVLASASAGVLLYYPRLQPAAPATESGISLADPLAITTLHANLRALPVADSRDGSPVLCHRAVFPASAAPLY
jgi:hypothetical protein